MHRKF